ncbi:helix-turn-helix domain-containing protein [Luteimonas sp. MJ204]|jgi:MerR family mercuric resistance operon transcriptional regulator|uniref:Helix-turn-helix domain-containing protein n=5 Tax=Lysobacteraceae TaxID=32033 RepID=A0A7W3YDS8_9GAMM|nr:MULTISPECIES: helix-turn-helix domain-containing protein [Xanthomonadaceae]PBJ81847.1 MerR family transcriptional regulator [Xanthomonadaceae bacterium NML93-0399]PBS12390.1 MerR family transcriptional regulator [Xanthomonadaceae bacterium NML93-0792]PBS15938.1 MerR family transcriptional regulator [Xanthomonadaceae bacterium NML93-0793]PBS18881.1 MerR family transcriptional regulator [Xanthomonadaceae bacterium NML93-0831]PJJ99267.1 MerR family transcriptional regulator [Xanthomonadaceae b
MKIGEVAERSGCHPETVRYYERIGLLPAPPRTAGGYRDYRPADADRLRFISRGRELGFSLEEIRSLLGLAEDDGLSCQDVDRLARGHLLDIRNRLNDLQRMASELERVIGSCSGGERGQCAILDTLRHPPS